MLSREKVEAVLFKMGMPANVKGFGYIVDGVLLLEEDSKIKTTYLYFKVAQQHGTTGQRVERAIRHAFDIVRSCRGDYDVVNHYIGLVIADTAGRLPTQINLMEELRRVYRSQGKALPGAPHEVLLVLDGTTGQNALLQVTAFDAATELTGLIITKLDGTAKGGVLVAIAQMRQSNPLPFYFIGVGEGIDDLQPFNALHFANTLVGLPADSELATE